ncbi:MAG: hypothetical protein AAF682_11830 [Planctomycetota bacterium]
MPATADPDRRELRPLDELHVRRPYRLQHVYATTPEGHRALYVYHGATEVCFDDPDDIPFGEGLLRQATFRAQDAMRWAARGRYGWEKVRGYLTVLLEEGVLAAGPWPAPSGGSATAFAPPDLGRAWSALLDPAKLTRELFGRACDLRRLELLVPGARVAQPAFDEAGRQVGEHAVDPPELRQDVETEWRICTEPGPRFHHPKPVNASALAALSTHWDAVLDTVAGARSLWADLFGLAPGGCLTVGQTELFASALAALPGYLLVRSENPLANGRLPVPVSSLYRVVDGLRSAAERLLADPRSAVRPDDSPGPAALLDVVERRGLFADATCIWAPPEPKLRSLLEVLMVGRGSRDRGPAVVRTEDVRTGLRYGLLALALQGNFEALLSRVTSELDLGLSEQAASRPVAHGLATELRRAALRLRRPRVASAEERASRAALRRWRLAECRRALSARPVRFPDAPFDGRDPAERIARLEAAALPQLSALQSEINRCLGRSDPAVTLSASDLAAACRARRSPVARERGPGWRVRCSRP